MLRLSGQFTGVGPIRVRTHVCLIPLLLALAPFAFCQNSTQATTPDPALVQRALANELTAAQDANHPMRYRLRKWTPRLITTKELVETRDGTIARLLEVNDRPLEAEQERKEQGRLRDLLGNPGKQRHRQQAQRQDTARALKVLRALPTAFVYRYAGPAMVGTQRLERFSFSPNPDFEAPDLETEALTALGGEILIDPVSRRVVRLDGRLLTDVDFGWGILGRLYKGGTLSIEQADVGGGVWRIVRFQMDLSARVVIRTRSFRTIEEESAFARVPVGMDYQQGVALLQSSPQQTARH